MNPGKQNQKTINQIKGNVTYPPWLLWRLYDTLNVYPNTWIVVHIMICASINVLFWYECMCHRFCILLQTKYIIYFTCPPPKSHSNRENIFIMYVCVMYNGVIMYAIFIMVERNWIYLFA